MTKDNCPIEGAIEALQFVIHRNPQYHRDDLVYPKLEALRTFKDNHVIIDKRDVQAMASKAKAYSDPLSESFLFVHAVYGLVEAQMESED